MRAPLALIAWVAASGASIAASGASIAASGASIVAVAALAACHAPPPNDPIARVLADPRDIPAHLAIAAAADQHGRPGEALEHLQIVETLGGPLGVRWHAEDRARMARLLLARAAARDARGAASALADFEHAHKLGAPIRGHDLAAARLGVALFELRHVSNEQRAAGLAHLAALATLPEAEPAWRGALPSATPEEHGLLGAWLWEQGARREAWEQLELWNRTSSQAGPIRVAYDAARAWWTGTPPVAEVQPALVPAMEHVEMADAPFVAAARYAHARFPGAPSEDALLVVARAYRREPVVGDRFARDLIAADVDNAGAHAALGALFDALGDPARARVQWQAAVDASPEPAFVRGLAESIARTGDSSSALIYATQAAAAWGDPAVVWIGVGETLDLAGSHVDALVCAHSAVDLAGPDELPRALDLAIAASHGLGRKSQVDAFQVQRIAAEPPHKAPEPTDPAAALLAYRTLPTAGTVARMWVAARAHPGDLAIRLELLAALPVDDPRRATIINDLVALAADPDPERGLAAVHALR